MLRLLFSNIKIVIQIIADYLNYCSFAGKLYQETILKQIVSPTICYNIFYKKHLQLNSQFIALSYIFFAIKVKYLKIAGVLNKLLLQMITVVMVLHTRQYAFCGNLTFAFNTAFEDTAYQQQQKKMKSPKKLTKGKFTVA